MSKKKDRSINVTKKRTKRKQTQRKRRKIIAMEKNRTKTFTKFDEKILGEKIIKSSKRIIFDFDDAIYTRPGKQYHLLVQRRINRRLHLWLKVRGTAWSAWTACCRRRWLHHQRQEVQHFREGCLS